MYEKSTETNGSYNFSFFENFSYVIGNSDNQCVGAIATHKICYFKRVDNVLKVIKSDRVYYIQINEAPPKGCNRCEQHFLTRR